MAKKRPDSIIPKGYVKDYDAEYLKELIETKDHVDILNWIRKEKLSLHSYADTDKDLTLVRQILDEAENGDEIIKEILDSFVTKTSVGSKEISLNSFNIKVDFSGILSVNEDGKQESVINDLVQLCLSYKSEPWDKFVDLVINGVERCKGTKKEKTEKENSPQIILGKLVNISCIAHML